MPYSDAFELASTMRHLKEVWHLYTGSEAGRLILPLLQGTLLQKEGGNLLVEIDELNQHKNVESETLEKYENLKSDTSGQNGEIVLEKVFGNDSFKTYKWYMNGADRCMAVARIGRDSSRGDGTGFILKGSDLNASLGDNPVLITNAHVISDNPADEALSPQEAIVTFEILDKDKEFRDLEIIWSSPRTELDVTILKFQDADMDSLKKLTSSLKFYRLGPYLPVIETPPTQKIYIIGHPLGGVLQLSFQDNFLLAHKDPKIHYRTPTEAGNSGSPVFNQQWDLIGLHHAGSKNMPCLDDDKKSYEANEGIWMIAIKNALGKFLDKDSNPI